jgi:hypothetical protein
MSRKRFMVTGTSQLDAGLIVTNVEPYTGQTYNPTQPATGGIPWYHWALARSAREARRASIRKHDAFVTSERALCGDHAFAVARAISMTDAGFNQAS